MVGSDSGAAQNPLRAARIVVIEDDPLIASLVQEYLFEYGTESVLIPKHLDEAKRVLSGSERLDGATIDVKFGADPNAGYALAEIALNRALPFVFVTGYGLALVPPGRFSHVTIVTKPFAPALLIGALCDAMAKGSSSA